MKSIRFMAFALTVVLALAMPAGAMADAHTIPDGTEYVSIKIESSSTVPAKQYYPGQPISLSGLVVGLYDKDGARVAAVSGSALTKDKTFSVSHKTAPKTPGKHEFVVTLNGHKASRTFEVMSVGTLSIRSVHAADGGALTTGATAVVSGTVELCPYADLSLVLTEKSGAQVAAASFPPGTGSTQFQLTIGVLEAGDYAEGAYILSAYIASEQSDIKPVPAFTIAQTRYEAECVPFEYPGEGTLSLIVKGAAEDKFESLFFDGLKANTSNYDDEERDQDVVVTLTEAFLLTLEPGQYRLHAVFKNGQAAAFFKVPEPEPIDSTYALETMPAGMKISETLSLPMDAEAAFDTNIFSSTTERDFLILTAQATTKDAEPTTIRYRQDGVDKAALVFVFDTPGAVYNYLNLPKKVMTGDIIALGEADLDVQVAIAPIEAATEESGDEVAPPETEPVLDGQDASPYLLSTGDMRAYVIGDMGGRDLAILSGGEIILRLPVEYGLPVSLMYMGIAISSDTLYIARGTTLESEAAALSETLDISLTTIGTDTIFFGAPRLASEVSEETSDALVAGDGT